jgi:hypothetical protein
MTRTPFSNKTGILSDLANFGYDTEKYGKFIQDNEALFNTTWLADTMPSIVDDEMTADVEKLWGMLMDFTKQKDTGFEQVDDVCEDLVIPEEEE